MKYINFKNVGIVVFESHISHSDMASRVNDEVVSAGMVEADELNPPMCFGNSHTLGVASLKTDTEKLRRRLGIIS